MITFSEDQIRRESYILGSWFLRDDDTPSPPECDALASGQRKRWIREHTLMGPSFAFNYGLFATAGYGQC